MHEAFNVVAGGRYVGEELVNQGGDITHRRVIAARGKQRGGHFHVFTEQDQLRLILLAGVIGIVKQGVPLVGKIRQTHVIPQLAGFDVSGVVVGADHNILVDITEYLFRPHVVRLAVAIVVDAARVHPGRRLECCRI